MTARVYVVEDHELVRDVVVACIDAMPEARVVGAAESAERALAEIERDPPDLVVADLSLPDMHGLALIRELTARFPDVKCLVLTGHAAESYRRRAREVGSRAFVAKDDPDELTRAIRAVLAGQRYESGAR